MDRPFHPGVSCHDRRRTGLWLFDFGDAHTLRKVLSYSGYVWMAFIFMTFAWFVLIDMVRLLFYILDGLPLLTVRRTARFSGSGRCIAVSAALSITVYGWFEALNIGTVTITIPTAKLPRGWTVSALPSSPTCTSGGSSRSSGWPPCWTQ